MRQGPCRQQGKGEDPSRAVRDERNPRSTETLLVLPSLEPETEGRYAVALAGEAGASLAVAGATRAISRELAATGALEIPLSLSTEAIAGWVLGRRVARLLRQLRPSRVHLVDARLAAAFLSPCRRLGIPLIAQVTRPLGSRGARSRQRAFRRSAGMSLLLVPSCHAAERIAAADPGADLELRLFRPAVDLRRFDSRRITGQRVAALAERLQIPPDRRIVLVPAPLRQHHGHLLLLEAMARLDRSDFDLLLVSPEAADEDFLDLFDHRVETMGLGERIRFAPGGLDLPALFHLADVVACPVEEEPLSCPALLQAQAMGRPVIASRAGCLPESMVPGETGWLLERRHPEELAMALERALDLDPGERRAVADRARGFVAESHALDERVQETLGLYREVERKPAGTVPRLVQMVGGA